MAERCRQKKKIQDQCFVSVTLLKQKVPRNLPLVIARKQDMPLVLPDRLGLGIPLYAFLQVKHLRSGIFLAASQAKTHQG